MDGVPGRAGADGKDGSAGKDGKNGKDGRNGIDGKDGLTGPVGPPGPIGKSRNPTTVFKTMTYIITNRRTWTERNRRTTWKNWKTRY